MPAPNGHDPAAAERIANALGGASRSGEGWMCKCPVPGHGDKNASLWLVAGDKLTVVPTCHAGCDRKAVLATLEHLGHIEPRRAAKPKHGGKAGRTLEATYSYPDEAGELLFQALRYRNPDGGKEFSQRRPDGAGGWIWNLEGVRRVPYRLPHVKDEPHVLLVEGEKCADRLASLSYPATTTAGGSGGWRKADLAPLAGKRVTILPDHDAGGAEYRDGTGRALRALGCAVHVLELPGLTEEGDDVVDWLDRGGTTETLTELVNAAPDWRPRARTSRASPVRDVRAREKPAPRTDWTDGLLTKGKDFAAVGANVLHALRAAPELTGRVRLNALSEQIEATDLPWCQGRDWQPWLETDDELLAEWLAHRDLLVKASLCGSCVATIAAANTHHPVRAYLAGLEWDGVPRLSLWLSTHLGAYDAPPEYVHAVGRAWLISLVARAMRPGCQVDHLLILEGPQGARKSSALRALVPDPAWFTDNISALGTKDSAQDLRGKWLIELSDLSAMKRTEVERIKAAISHPVDHYRPSYGRYSRDFPRQCVFAGTTNEHAYLFDSTGNRRFWCLKVARIDLEGLKRDRAQLWAEAVHAFEAGEKWHLEPAMELLAAAEQAKRREEEPFTGPVLDWVAQTAKPEFHIVDIMRGIGILDTSKHTKAEAMRIAAILRDAGCARRHTMHGSAWRKMTPAEGCQGLSGQVVSPSGNDFNDLLETDTSTPVLPQTLHARVRDGLTSCTGAHAHDTGENEVEVSAGRKPLKPNGDALNDTSLTPPLTPPWAADWPTWDGRCGADPAAIRDWIALAGGTSERRDVTLPASCRQHPAALKRLLSHITLQAWKVDWS